MSENDIIFHSQIWPAELLGYSGQSVAGGGPGRLGVPDLPTEVASNEFLTMEGKKLSSSHGIVIYVRDFLECCQANALRYFIYAAGSETVDTDFTWVEFVRRTGGEFAAGWGDLVNRAASMIHKRFGQIPEPAKLQNIDRTLSDVTKAGFASVGDLIAQHRQKAALGETMRLVGEANKYIADAQSFRLKSKDPATQAHLATVLHTLARAIIGLDLMLSSFLPHIADDVDRVLGESGRIVPMSHIEEVAELDLEHLPETPDDRTDYSIITGDYQDAPAWGRHLMTVGTPVAKPTPVFTKLDGSIAEAELARYAGSVLDNVTGS